MTQTTAPAMTQTMTPCQDPRPGSHLPVLFDCMQRFEQWLRNHVVHCTGKKLTAEEIRNAFLSASGLILNPEFITMLAPLALNMPFTKISSSISSRNVSPLSKLVFYNLMIAD